MPKVSAKFVTRTGEPISMGGQTITPVSQALMVQCREMGPTHAGLVWNRPTGVVVQSENGSRSLIPVVDVTRLVQLAIFAAGFLGVLLIRQFYQSRR